MAALDNEKKSSRLLASRRYTHETLTAAQEAFTETLDLRSSEIYTQGHLVPATGLPHSGSSQNGETHSVSGMQVTKYWYRHKLTKSNLNNEAWFFLNPTGSNSGVGAQLIDSGQQTNFISPKYSDVSLANASTEDATPGYGIVVYKSTSTNSGSLSGADVVSGNDYVFDYKTGVLQFNSSAVDPSDSEYVYMTVYQYVGTTARTGIDVSGAISASAFKGDGSQLTGISGGGSGIFAATGSIMSTTNTVQITGSLTVSAAVTASAFKGDGSALTGLPASYTQAEISGALGPNATFLRNLTAAKVSGSTTIPAGTVSSSTQIASEVSGALGTNASFIRGLTETKISESLGSNATLIRNLTAGKISGSLGDNAVFIRSLTAAKVSGSLGANAVFLRNLTSTKVSGAFQGGGSNLISGSAVSTGSFGKLLGDGSSLTGVVTTQTVQSNAFEVDANGDLMPIIGTNFAIINYELDAENDLMPR